MQLYPLRFEPVYQYRLWGGRRLSDWLNAALPGDDPIGEAWILSDREEHSSVVAGGALKGQTLRQLLQQWPTQLMGPWTGGVNQFPLLLKFLDVRGSLSVQVHPSDQQTALLPAGDSGKTEGWVILAAGTEARVYAGLTPDTTGATFRGALADGTVVEHLASFRPKIGDAVVIPAGTVHCLHDLLVFEVQENSDVTFRLYDWNLVDPKTHKPRPLQVEEALACINFPQGAIGPSTPIVEDGGMPRREQLFDCGHFALWRIRSERLFGVGGGGMPRFLVCIDGMGQIMHDGNSYAIGKGDVMLLPAELGACSCVPLGSITLLDVSLPVGA
jgi:mannose-6-phosphate isomerase